jgi:hypothetical protein
MAFNQQMGKISFDLKDFQKDKSSLLKFLISLRRAGVFYRTEELDDFFTQQPIYAYNYVKKVLVQSRYNLETKNTEYLNSEKNKLSADKEKIFIKNIKIAIGYLKITNQIKFKDEKINARFEKKLYRDPILSYDYAMLVLKEGRIPEEKEEVFIKNPYPMFLYSANILKEHFSNNIHKKIVLMSFSEEYKNISGQRYIKSYLGKDFSGVRKKTIYGY